LRSCPQKGKEHPVVWKVVETNLARARPWRGLTTSATEGVGSKWGSELREIHRCISLFWFVSLSYSHCTYFIYSFVCGYLVMLVCECRHTLNKSQITQKHHQAPWTEEGKERKQKGRLTHFLQDFQINRPSCFLESAMQDLQACVVR